MKGSITFIPHIIQIYIITHTLDSYVVKRSCEAIPGASSTRGEHE